MLFNLIGKSYKTLFEKIRDQISDNRRHKLKNFDTKYFSFVFLCGGNRKEYNSRDLLLGIFENDKKMKFLIGENLNKLTSGLDLLSFEKILADISKMIVIPIESMGTACELGAFTLLSIEENKVVAIVDRKYYKDDSFIRLGPIAVLNKMGKDRVLWTSFCKRKEITYMKLTQEISDLYKHPLLNSKMNNDRLFLYDDSSKKLEICNFYTFFAFLIDFACVFKRINQAMVEDYLTIVYKVNEISFKELKYNVKNVDIFNCLLNLLVSYGYLSVEKNTDFYVLCRDFISKSQLPENYDYGSTLFTKIIKKTDINNKIRLFSEIAILSEKKGNYGNH